MQLRSRLVATAVATIPLIALVTTPAVSLAADPPVTLRFAVADGEGRPSDPYVRAFVQEVAVRSGGSVTLDPIWDAGGDDFEQGVARMLVAGDADVALAAGRSWATTGISSLDALQAPFLIADDALAAAVATSPTAIAMLDGMAADGAVGLALWPEDLRHPVAWESCMAPITAPEQLQGRTVRAIPSGVTLEMLTALGATQLFVDNYASLVESCEIQAAESGLRQGGSLPGTPTFTGDVTFFPKFQVLAVAPGAFEQLTPAQQAAVRESAIAVRDQALAEHSSEADAAAAWCAEGGRVVLAGPDEVAAFQKAAQPVFDRMSADPVSGPAIESIRSLAESVEPALGASACGPVESPSPAQSGLATDWRALGFVGASIPDGTYRISVTKDELLGLGGSEVFAQANGDAAWTLAIAGDKWTASMKRGTHTDECAGEILTVDGPAQRLPTTVDHGCGMDCDLLWRPAPGGVELKLIAVGGDPNHPNVFQDGLVMDRVWLQVD